MSKKIENKEYNKLYEEILSLKKNLMNFSFQKSSGQLEKLQIKNTRKNIARIKLKCQKLSMEIIMPKRILSGIVVSSNLNKTIVVNVTRRIKHKLYKKIIRRSKKYHVHDENNSFKIGDNVSIIESKPISKQKKWVVLENAGENK